MAHKKSAIKRIRTSEKSNLRNSSIKSALRTKIKWITQSEDAETANTKLPLLARALDKAASKNVIHKKTASRLKSRLTLLVNRKLAAAK